MGEYENQDGSEECARWEFRVTKSGHRSVESPEDRFPSIHRRHLHLVHNLDCIRDKGART